MDLINALTTADTLKINVSFDYRVDTDIPIDTIQGNASTTHCITKNSNSLNFSINTAVFNLPPHLINVTGILRGVNADGDPLVEWSINENPNPPVSFTAGPYTINFNSIQGSVLTKLRQYDPVWAGPNCTGATETIVCFFEIDGSISNNSIIITGDHATTISLSNIIIFSDMGLAPFLKVDIIPHHNHSTDCGDHFDFIGEEVAFTTDASTVPPYDNLVFKWSADVGEISGPDNLRNVKIILPSSVPDPTIPGVLKLSAAVTDTDIGVTQIFTCVMKYYDYSWSRVFYITCELKKLSQLVFRRHIPFDPGDPAFRNIYVFLNSREELFTLLSRTRHLEASIERHMTLRGGFNLK